MLSKSKGFSPFLLTSLLALAACENQSTPTQPPQLPGGAVLAKGNAGGGGEFPMPTGRLYFASDIHEPGNLDIYAVNPDGTGLVRLTTAPGDDMLARAAMTTDRVAFFSDRAGSRQLFMMNTDGTGQVAVYTPSAGTLADLGLSSDGARVAVIRTIGGQTDIWAVNADGTGLTQLTNDAAVERTVAWSPNGRELVYSATVGGQDDVFKLNVGRGTISRLTSGSGANVSPSFSPDGRNIVFASTRDGNYELYTMRSGGTQQARLLDKPSWHEVGPVYSPDGVYVAYLSYLANGTGPVGMRYIGVGTTGQTGPVSTSSSIMSVSWGR